MDADKTGALIAQVRLEKGLTQRELAQGLHLSDRTISKWERGAGFPDVSLLEPLASALELTVAELLRGERSAPDAGDEAALLEAIAVIRRQMSRKVRDGLGGLLLGLFFLGLALWWLLFVAPFSQKVELTLDVGVYQNGVQVGETTAVITGERTRRILGENSFWGHIALEYVEKTCREDVYAGVNWSRWGIDRGLERIRYTQNASFPDIPIQYYCYVWESMEAFALKLEDGTVLATHDNLARLAMLDDWYQLVH